MFKIIKTMIKKLYDKLLYGLAVIWIVPFFRYAAIAYLIAVIIGLIRGTSPLYDIF